MYRRRFGVRFSLIELSDKSHKVISYFDNGDFLLTKFDFRYFIIEITSKRIIYYYIYVLYISLRKCKCIKKRGIAAAVMMHCTAYIYIYKCILYNIHADIYVPNVFVSTHVYLFELTVQRLTQILAHFDGYVFR